MKTIEATRLNLINEYYFSKKLTEISKMKDSGQEILNLGIGNPDLPPPEKVITALNDWSINQNVHGYQSYKGIPELREAIANWSSRIYDIHLDASTEILPLVGSKEGIMHISQAFVNQGDSVLIPNPGYPTYKSVSHLVQAETITYKICDEKGLDIQEISKLIKPNTKIIWINFPHMPTGIKACKNTLLELIQLAKEKRFIIVNDNPYSTILTDEFFSIFQIKGAKDVCLELNSLSKSHNMAGWRLGWVSGNKSLINTILKVKSNMDSGMFFPLQKAAVNAFYVPDNWITSINYEYKKRRKIAWEIFDLLNCEYNKDTSGLFIWGKIPDSKKSSDDYSNEILHESKVFIAPGFIFGSEGENHIRISLCNSTEILNKALNNIKTKLKC